MGEGGCTDTTLFLMYVATHGSGIGHVNLAAMVTKLELITGQGDVLTLTPQDDQDVFKAALVREREGKKTHWSDGREGGMRERECACV